MIRLQIIFLLFVISLQPVFANDEEWSWIRIDFSEQQWHIQKGNAKLEIIDSKILATLYDSSGSKASLYSFGGNIEKKKIY